MNDNEQIEKAFEEFDADKYWRPEDRLDNGFERTYFEAGYKAGSNRLAWVCEWDFDATPGNQRWFASCGAVGRRDPMNFCPECGRRVKLKV